MESVREREVRGETKDGESERETFRKRERGRQRDWGIELFNTFTYCSLE